MTRKVFLWLTVLVSLPLTISPPDVFAAAKTLSFVEMQRDDRSGLESASSLALSPDGLHAYVAGVGALVALARDAATGELTIVDREFQGGAIDGLVGGSNSVAVSPDGAHVYVTSSGTVALFSRDQGTGELTFVEVLRDGIRNTEGLAGARSVTLSPDGNQVYVAATGIRTPGSAIGSVVVFDRDAATGTLTFLERHKEGKNGVEGLNTALGIAVSPDGATVYAVGFRSDALAVFGRDAGTGGLTFLEVHKDGQAGVDGLYEPISVTVSPDAAHVYVAATGGVAVFRRDSGTGALTFVEVQRNGVGGVTGLSRPMSVTLSPDGAHVYVATSGSDSVVVFDRDAATGALTFVEVQQDGVGGASVTVSPDGNHVYVARGGAVVGFLRDGVSGTLSLVEVERGPADGIDGLDFPASVTVSLDGASVYVASGWSSSGTGTVVVFNRNPVTGSLSLVEVQRGGVGGVTGLGGWSKNVALTISPDGDHLYVASEGSDALVVFSREAPSGALTFVQVLEDGVGGVTGLGRARSVAVSPDGGNVYVASHASATRPQVAVFSRDAGTGTLTFLQLLEEGVGGVTGLTAPHAVAVSPDGAHVYVAGTGRAGENDAAIAVFSRDLGTGLLTFVEAVGAHALAEVGGDMSLALSPDGAHLYAVAAGSDSIAAFGRDAGTGRLTFVELQKEGEGGVAGLGSEPPNAGPRGVTVSPDGSHIYVASDGVVVFKRSASTGTLAFVEAQRSAIDAPLLDGARSVAVSPDGQHVYVAAPGEGAQAVDVFAVTPQDCDPTPAANCLQVTVSGKSLLFLKDGADDLRDVLRWRWGRGEEVTEQDLGDPLNTSGYRLCLYDASAAPQPLLTARAPAGGNCKEARPCWKESGATKKKFKYVDRALSPDGLWKLSLQTGAAGRGKIEVRGRGPHLEMPSLPLTLPAVVQLHNLETGVCWEAQYSTSIRNLPDQLKSRGD